jgi:hypothetical protein
VLGEVIVRVDLAAESGEEPASPFVPLQPVSVANAITDTRPKKFLLFITVSSSK